MQPPLPHGSLGGGTGGTGPPVQRRSLLGSARTYQQPLASGSGGGKGYVLGYGHGHALGSGSGNTPGIGRGIGHVHASGSGSTAPRSRGGGSKPSSMRDREREREKDKERADIVVGGTEEDGGGEGDEIRCRCGSSIDDGFSIACDVCGRWCHAACFGISKESVPEEWACWVCARKDTNGHKSRRRASISNRRSTTSPHLPVLGLNDELYEDERAQYVQIEDDIVPHAATQRKLRAYAAHWRGVSALAQPGANPAPGEGHTPFVFRNPPAPHPTVLHPCPPSHSFSSSPYLSSVPFPPSCSSALPPTYALHTLVPAPPHTLLASYPSLITPSSQYLAHPPNGYAHLGAPRKFVHIVGRPLDVALDARGVGGRGRWARSGCWPNAEVRAYVCAGASSNDGTGTREKPRSQRDTDAGGAAGPKNGANGEEAQVQGGAARMRNGKDKDAEGSAGDGEEPRTHFGIFATRALKQGEEIVVGWEWDDANAVHRIGEVASGPAPQLGTTSAPTPRQRDLIAQLANILHALGGAGTECACALSSSLSERPPRKDKDGQEVGKESAEGGAGDETCVIRAVERVVFPPAQVPAPPPRHFPSSEEEMDVDVDVVGEGEEPSLLPAAAVGMTRKEEARTETTAKPKTKPKHKRLAGPGVPPPSPEALVPVHPSAAYPSFSAHPASHVFETHPFSAYPPALHIPSAYGGARAGHAGTSHEGRWGPLIGAMRGVRAVERVRGSGGWGGVVLTDADADAYAASGSGWTYDEAAYAGVDGYGYGVAGPSGSRRVEQVEKAYEVLEDGEGSGKAWDIVRGSEYGDRAGGEEDDPQASTSTSTNKPRTRRRSPSLSSDGDTQAREATCPPKMRKRWKGADGRAVPVPSRTAAMPSSSRPAAVPAARLVVAPRVETLPATQSRKGKEKALEMEVDAEAAPPATREADGRWNVKDMRTGKKRVGDMPMDVDDVADSPASFTRSPFVVPLVPPLAVSPVPPVAPPPVLPAAAPPDPSPSTRFAQLTLRSPYPGPPPHASSSWFSLGGDGGAGGTGGEDGEVLEHGEDVRRLSAGLGRRAQQHTCRRWRWGVVDADSAAGADIREHRAQESAVDEDRRSAASPSPAPAAEGSSSPVVPAVSPTLSTPPPSHAPLPWDDDGTIPSTWLHQDSDYQNAQDVQVDQGSPTWSGPSCRRRGVRPPPPPPASLPADAPPPASSPLLRDPPPPPRDPTPAPAPAPAVTRLSVKEWNQRRKLEREVEERERERAREQEREREREREKERERERDLAQEDKENEEVVSSTEDGLNRILDGIRRSANEKAPPVSVPVQQDVEMCGAAPLVVPTPSIEEPQPRDKLSMAAFATTGNGHLLSPLTVTSVVDSRTPSPHRVNGVKREVSPPVVDEPTVATAVPPPPSPSPAPAPPPPPSVLHSPKAPRFPSPAFTSNGVARPLPPHLQLPRAERSTIFQTHPNSPPRGPPQRFPAYEAAVSSGAPPLRSPRRSPSPEPPTASSSVFHPFKALRPPTAPTTSGNAHSVRPTSSGNTHSGRPDLRLMRRPHVPEPSQKEGEILPGSSSPPAWRPRVNSYSTPASASAPRTSYFAQQHSPTPSQPTPPTQPRSYRAPPSAPKALREASAQNPNAIALGGGGGGPVRPRFNGMGPQTIPPTVLDASRSRRGTYKKRR
ncbi:hypothetical protein MSAN_01109600 [Mycena sanguinolenta]|uniref:PHD-type domain-containing protein n=1 Tax=Mycena sanguinolenta TaxID=230812 RepID=A0A8H7DAB5_9AGAR|nr:hypothetical protein MSAN_01109600 [Mycena sanguinolenta]